MYPSHHSAHLSLLARPGCMQQLIGPGDNAANNRPARVQVPAFSPALIAMLADEALLIGGVLLRAGIHWRAGKEGDWIHELLVGREERHGR